MYPYGVISIRRTVELSGAPYSYQVLIDGVLAGRVRTGRTAQFPVAPGRHRVRVTQSWSASIPLDVEVAPGGHHYLLTGTGRTLDSLFRPRRYLRLVPVPAANGGVSGRSG